MPWKWTPGAHDHEVGSSSVRRRAATFTLRPPSAEHDRIYLPIDRCHPGLVVGRQHAAQMAFKPIYLAINRYHPHQSF